MGAQDDELLAQVGAKMLALPGVMHTDAVAPPGTDNLNGSTGLFRAKDDSYSGPPLRSMAVTMARSTRASVNTAIC